MALKGGTLTNFNDSMAQAIEFEFERIWKEKHGGKELPASSREERRWMFVAIATGVVNHLASHNSGFHIDLPVDTSGRVIGYVNEFYINLPVDSHGRVVGNVNVIKE